MDGLAVSRNGCLWPKRRYVSRERASFVFLRGNKLLARISQYICVYIYIYVQGGARNVIPFYRPIKIVTS